MTAPRKRRRPADLPPPERPIPNRIRDLPANAPAWYARWLLRQLGRAPLPQKQETEE